MVRPRVCLMMAVLVSGFCAFSGAESRDDFFRVEDLRPGMKGTGKTCFQGTEPEEFDVEILGILRGVSPGADAVLAGFSGGGLEKTGIFSGMSGSPVFIDGKLLGAVAFSYPYVTEAIGGITPIGQMIAAFEESAALPSGLIYKKSRLWNYRLPLPASGLKAAELPELIPHTARLSDGGYRLLPIATPVNLGGFDSRAIKTFAPVFSGAGMTFLEGAAVGAASGVSPAAAALPFYPGGNIAVSLVQGDLDVSAGGTVTWVDGDRLYAFGHELMSMGFTELPMRSASTITVIPNLESSFRVFEAGAVMGTVRQDRNSGIFGIIGERPRMTPLDVRLTTSRRVHKTFRYEIARDALLTPSLVSLVVYNTILASEREHGFLTLRVEGKIRVKNQPDVEIGGRFSSSLDAATGASMAVAVPINYLMAGGYENLDIEGIDVEITAIERDQLATLDSIRLDRTEVRSGETVELNISCVRANGTEIQRSYQIKIPENISPGRLSLVVADGAALTEADDIETGNLIPRDLSQLIRLINNV
ncbi:MAG: hypothetical protein FWF13_03865, partial [Acidobacteria bacterium]|nr:hypothetical protein [Acidobacteriota bacterium]